MRLFPLFADLDGRAVLVVGGGDVAERKTRALLEAGALVTAGAPHFSPSMAELARRGEITLRHGGFQPDWLDGQWLVVAATDDRAVNARISAAAAERRMLANVVDDPELSSFQVPSIVDRAPLVIAISSAGAAPVLARRLRERMEALFDHSLGDLAGLAQQYRARIRERHADMGERRRFYDWMFDGPVAASLRAGQPAAAERMLSAALAAAQEPAAPARVLLVGAGPGPAARMTLQGLRALNEADVVIHHEDVGADILAMVRRDADRVVWPACAPARELVDCLARHATDGRCVVYLQPGAAPDIDASALAAALAPDVVCEVAPGLPLA